MQSARDILKERTKEKQKNKSTHLSIVQMNNSTNEIKGSTPNNRIQDNINRGTIDKQDKSTEELQPEPLRIASRKNAEVDQYLLSLLMDDTIDEQFWSWHAKAIHTLGLSKYNKLVIVSRNGRKPKQLLSYMVKGALQLHAKHQFLDES